MVPIEQRPRTQHWFEMKKFPKKILAPIARMAPMSEINKMVPVSWVPKRFQNEKIPRKNFDDANNMVAKTEILKMIASGEVNKKVQNEKIPRKNFGARCVGLAHLVPKVPGIMVGVPPSKQGGV
jgi:hypothetical protein